MTLASGSPWRRRLARLAVLAGSLLLVCLVGEITLRASMATNPNRLRTLLEPPPYRGDGALRLIDLLRPDPDPRVAYTMRPGQRGRFQGALVRIHSLGGRGPEFESARPPGTFRIVGLGDSHLFGWGVEEEETVLAQLPELLPPPPGRDRIETINLAVPGYNTVQEVRAFERVVDTLQPDLVLILFVGNDADLPNFLYEPPSPWRHRSLFLVEFVRSRTEALWRRGHLALGLIHSPQDEQQRFVFSPDAIPERFRVLQGWPAAIAAYDELIQLLAERQIPLVVLFDANDYTALLAGSSQDVHSRAAIRLARHLDQPGVLVVDTQERVLAHLQKMNLPASSVWLSERDPHPNRLRNQLIASELAERLAELPIWRAPIERAAGPRP